MKVEVNAFMLVRECNLMIAHIIRRRGEERREKLQKAKDQNYKPARSYLFGLIKFPERILTDEQAAEVIKLEEYPLDWDDIAWGERERNAQLMIESCGLSTTNLVELDPADIKLLSWWAKESGRNIPFAQQEAA